MAVTCRTAPAWEDYINELFCHSSVTGCVNPGEARSGMKSPVPAVWGFVLQALVVVAAFAAARMS
jgi:hypothetical protein